MTVLEGYDEFIVTPRLSARENYIELGRQINELFSDPIRDIAYLFKVHPVTTRRWLKDLTTMPKPAIVGIKLAYDMHKAHGVPMSELFKAGEGF